MPAEPGALALPDVAGPAAPARRALRPPGFPFAISGLFVLAAVVAPLLGLPDPHAQSLRDRFKPPAWEEAGSWKPPLGTDRLGRDLLSRIVWGSRVSLAAGGLSMVVAGLPGCAGRPDPRGPHRHPPLARPSPPPPRP